jgi:transcriptional regulator CtsR
MKVKESQSQEGDYLPRISDIIEDFIKQMLEESSEDILQIKRNELAMRFGCVPSQINYVLMTRFTVDKGYYIESKRGGGGSITITKVSLNPDEYLSDLIAEGIGSSISQNAAEAYINSFKDQGLISDRESAFMKAAVNDKSLWRQSEDRDALRANILKAMLLILINM